MRDRGPEARMERAGSCQSANGVTCFQHQHTLAASRQICGTNKSIVAGADDNRVNVLHLKFTPVKMILKFGLEILDLEKIRIALKQLFQYQLPYPFFEHRIAESVNTTFVNVVIVDQVFKRLFHL
jgi:hypothetical protein